MCHLIASSLITVTLATFPATGKHGSASPGFRCSIQGLFPSMCHNNKDCGPFYQPVDYKSLQQDFSGMRTFLGHRIVSDWKKCLVSLNKLNYCLFYQGINSDKVNTDAEFKQNKQFSLCWVWLLWKQRTKKYLMLQWLKILHLRMDPKRDTRKKCGNTLFI